MSDPIDLSSIQSQVEIIAPISNTIGLLIIGYALVKLAGRWLKKAEDKGYKDDEWYKE